MGPNNPVSNINRRIHSNCCYRPGQVSLDRRNCFNHAFGHKRISKDKDFAAEQKEHMGTASKLWPLREEYISLMTDFDDLPDDTIVSRRDDLMGKTAKIYESAPQTDEKAYAAAQDALKNKEEQFFTQEELNVMLPIHLRKTTCKETNK